MKYRTLFPSFIAFMAAGSPRHSGAVPEIPGNDNCQSNAALLDESDSVSSCSNDFKHESTSMQLMTYDIGNGPQKSFIYVEPDVQSFYNNDTSKHKVQPVFMGRYCKFINILNTPILLYWDRRTNGQVQPVLVRRISPLSAIGITAFVGSRFSFRLDMPPAFQQDSDDKDLPVILERFQITDGTSFVFSINVTREDNHELVQQYVQSLPLTGPQDQAAYDWLQKTLAYDRFYFDATGRSFLSRYGRPLPENFMWPADYFGQTHTVSTLETHFQRSVPPETVQYAQQQEYDRLALSQYRPIDEPLNMTLTVISCAPRAFEIPNFLSPIEVQHLTDLAAHKELATSLTGDRTTRSASVRTSANTWISRYESPLVEAIYRRAADLLRIDHQPSSSDSSARRHPPPPLTFYAEPLQLVRYRVGEEYKAHVDFGFPKAAHADQPTRFATLLLYLNNVTQGGETSFPLWSNAETGESLKIVPQSGKAALFYMQTPDGNMDEKSLHEALPVLEGEKLMANMWIWDPYMDTESLK